MQLQNTHFFNQEQPSLEEEKALKEATFQSTYQSTYQTLFAIFKEENQRKIQTQRKPELANTIVEDCLQTIPNMDSKEISKLVCKFLNKPKRIMLWSKGTQPAFAEEYPEKYEPFQDLHDSEEDSESEEEESDDEEEPPLQEEGNEDTSEKFICKFPYDSNISAYQREFTVNHTYANKLQSALLACLAQDILFFDGDTVYDNSYKDYDGNPICLLICDGVPKDFFSRIDATYHYNIPPPSISYPTFSISHLHYMTKHFERNWQNYHAKANFPTIWIDLSKERKETLLANLDYHVIHVEESPYLYEPFTYRFLMTHFKSETGTIYIGFHQAICLDSGEDDYDESKYNEEEGEKLKLAAYKCIENMDKLAIRKFDPYKDQWADGCEHIFDNIEYPYSEIYTMEGGAKLVKDMFLPYRCVYKYKKFPFSCPEMKICF